MQLILERIFLFAVGFLPSAAFGQSCDQIFPNSSPLENSHRQKTQSWLSEILSSNLLPEASKSDGKSVDFSFQLVRKKILLKEEIKGVLSGDGLYFFTQPQSLDLTKPDSRLLDVRSNAWASVDHDYASINRSAFIQSGGPLWSRGSTIQKPEDRLLLKQNDAFHIKWYNPNGTIKIAQRFTFPVQSALQIPSQTAWVVIPEKNRDYLADLWQSQNKKKILSEYFNQPILIYGQDSMHKDFRFVLEDSHHLTSGDDFLSPTPTWAIGPHFIVRAVSTPADSIHDLNPEKYPLLENTLYENEIYFWSARNGKKLIHLSKNFFLKSLIVDPLLSIKLSPDENFLACIFKNHIRFFHLPTESWKSVLSWDHLSAEGNWNPEGSVFLAQDDFHFLKFERESGNASELSSFFEGQQFHFQSLPKKNYGENAGSPHQPIQWLNDRVFVSRPEGHQKTIIVDVLTGNSLHQILDHLPGLIFNNSNIAYRVIRSEGSTSYQLEVYQKVHQQPK